MRFAFALCLFFAASLVSAQETYSIPGSAPNVATLTSVVTSVNRATCFMFGQVAACTQAQACTAANAAGGASCTAAQARAVNARIYPATQAGREEFVLRAIVEPKFNELVSVQNSETRKTFCDTWTAANTTARNNACSAIGAAAGCDPLCQ